MTDHPNMNAGATGVRPMYDPGMHGGANVQPLNSVRSADTRVDHTERLDAAIERGRERIAEQERRAQDFEASRSSRDTLRGRYGSAEAAVDRALEYRRVLRNGDPNAAGELIASEYLQRWNTDDDAARAEEAKAKAQAKVEDHDDDDEELSLAEKAGRSARRLDATILLPTTAATPARGPRRVRVDREKGEGGRVAIGCGPDRAECSCRRSTLERPARGGRPPGRGAWHGGHPVASSGAADRAAQQQGEAANLELINESVRTGAIDEALLPEMDRLAQTAEFRSIAPGIGP